MNAKNIIITSLLVIMIGQFQGCDVVEYNTFTSYVNTYYKYNDINLSLTPVGNIMISGASFDKHYSWQSKGNDKDIYENLCKTHNDISYNKKRELIVGTNWGHCSMLDFKRIDIMSNIDFDQKHPAGTSLNDIIRFISVSPKKYIDSNYAKTYDWLNGTPDSFKKEQEMYNFRNGTESKNYYPIDKLLSEISINEMVMMPSEYFGYLIFEATPTGLKEHQLTITVSLSDGKIIVKTIKKLF